MSEGRGSLNFRLVNMREDVIIGFVRGGMYVCIYVCVCVCVCFAVVTPQDEIKGNFNLWTNPMNYELHDPHQGVGWVKTITSVVIYQVS